MLTTVLQLKKMRHRTWAGVRAHLAYSLAVFNILVQWNGFSVDADHHLHLSIAPFSL